MRPATLHYVITTEHSATYGCHFYASSSVQDTIRGIIHVYFMEDIITNTSHTSVRTCLHRMLLMWMLEYKALEGQSAPLSSVWDPAYIVPRR